MIKTKYGREYKERWEKQVEDIFKLCKNYPKD